MKPSVVLGTSFILNFWTVPVPKSLVVLGMQPPSLPRKIALWLDLLHIDRVQYEGSSYFFYLCEWQDSLITCSHFMLFCQHRRSRFWLYLSRGKFTFWKGVLFSVKLVGEAELSPLSQHGRNGMLCSASPLIPLPHYLRSQRDLKNQSY